MENKVMITITNHFTSYYKTKVDIGNSHLVHKQIRKKIIGSRNLHV